ncbi:apolipoprotein L6-like isoform X1 [Arapaima gigas]
MFMARQVQHIFSKSGGLEQRSSYPHPVITVWEAEGPPSPIPGRLLSAGMGEEHLWLPAGPALSGAETCDSQLATASRTCRPRTASAAPGEHLAEEDVFRSPKTEKSKPAEEKWKRCLSSQNIKEDFVLGEMEQSHRSEGEELDPKHKNARKFRNPFLPRREKQSKAAQRDLEEQPESAQSDQSVTLENNDDREKRQVKDDLTDQKHPEPAKDPDGLTEWRSTVEGREDVPVPADLSEKEEAKSFVVTVQKVQKGIRIFNKLFVERAEVLWQHVVELHAIANSIDRVNKKAKIASITGGSTSAVGGVATIAGLALAPVTMGTSLIVTAVGLGVTTAGGLTSASAGISSTINNSLDHKKVERIVQDYQAKMADINKCLTFIQEGMENLRKYDLVKMKKGGYNQEFPELHSIYKDGAMAGKAIVCNAAEIMRVVQIANVAGSTAARAIQLASMATGVLTGFFVGMDIYFVAKDSRELQKGAKSKFAAKIREVADQLHTGLVELNSIRQELQEVNIQDWSPLM